MYDCILKILKENQNKTIAIVSHATDISYLLNKWCNIKIEDNYSYDIDKDSRDVGSFRISNGNL